MVARADERRAALYIPSPKDLGEGDAARCFGWASVGGMGNTYVYDALGRRVGQTSGSLTTQYVYDGLNVAQEQPPSGGRAEKLAGSRSRQQKTSRFLAG